MKQSRMPHPIFFGLALITVGLLFLLREIDVLPDIRFWTLLWLGIGGWLFVGTLAGRRRGWFWPLTLVGVGTLMLLQDIDTIRHFSLWPIAIIGMGGAMVIETVTARNRKDNDESPVTWRDV